MFVNVSWQKVRPGAVKDLTEAAKKNAPDVTKAKGFVAYYVVSPGAGRFVTISVFEEKADAEHWAEKAKEHARQANLKKYLDDSPGSMGAFGGTVLYSKP